MIRVLTIALAAVAIAGAADARNNKHGSQGGGFCPPGLAKKNNGCMPPGLAKRGDYYHDYDYEKLDRKDSRYDFYRIGDIVVSADRKTGRILHLFDELGNLIE